MMPTYLSILQNFFLNFTSFFTYMIFLQFFTLMASIHFKCKTLKYGLSITSHLPYTHLETHQSHDLAVTLKTSSSFQMLELDTWLLFYLFLPCSLISNIQQICQRLLKNLVKILSIFPTSSTLTILHFSLLDNCKSCELVS